MRRIKRWLQQHSFCMEVKKTKRISVMGPSSSPGTFSTVGEAVYDVWKIKTSSFGIVIIYSLLLIIMGFFVGKLND